MSSVPVSSSGSIAGVGVVGCSAQSESIGPPHNSQTSTHLAPQPPIPSVQSESKPPLRHVIEPEKRARNRTAEDLSRSDDGHASARDLREVVQADRIPNVPTASGNLHRICLVREQQGLSIRTAAKRLGLTVAQYKRLEDPKADLSLSQLLAVQKVLDVPLVDLLVENNALSRPIEERAKLVKTMKTAVAIREADSTPRVGYLSQMLCEQLVELMPELSDVSGWPQLGGRRGSASLGKILSQTIDTSHLNLPPE